MIGTRGVPATHGGVERAVEALARNLAAMGHDVTIYGRRGYCQDTPNGLPEGVRQIALPAVSSKHLEAFSHTALATAHALTHQPAYDVVHFHATGPALFAGAMRLRGTPTVATIHGLDWQREKWGRFATTVLKVAARAAATVPTETIVVSRRLQQEVLATYGTTSTYVPNGVDFSELEDSRPLSGLTPHQYVLFLGRLVPEKQAHLLIQAFRHIPTDMKLVIAGPSLHADKYLEVIRRSAASDSRVLLVGPRYGAKKAWLIRNARVLVQPSTLEGLPITPLEALSLGTEVLVSDIPGNLEAITIAGDRYGTTFRVGDLESLITELVPYTSSAARRSPDARHLTRRAFDWTSVAEETAAVYSRAMAKG